MERKDSEKSSEKTKAFEYVKSNEMKVCFIGDASVGKTSIIHRFIKHSYCDRLPSTLGGLNQAIELTYLEHRLKYWLWDLGGGETYRNIVPSYFRGASAFILVYDCTEENSFENIRFWHDLTHKHTGRMAISDDLIFILVGNKTDKRDEMPANISAERGKELAKTLRCAFHETSALTGEGVTTLFDKLAQRTLENEKRRERIRARSEVNSVNGRETPVDGISLSDQHQQQQRAKTRNQCNC